MVRDRLEEEDSPSQCQVMKKVAPKLGVAAESLRCWYMKAEIDAGARSRVTTSESLELRRLKREDAELDGLTKS